MARERTGTIQRYEPAKPGERHGHYVVRVTAPDGTRPLFHLDPSPKSPEAEKMARAHAAGIAEQLAIRGLGATRRRPAASRVQREPDDGAAWFDAWLADRKRRGLVGHVHSDLKHYIVPVIGKHPRDWTPEDLRAFCRCLDDKVLAGTISWKTASNIWGTATRISKDACRSKVDALRVRDDNPALGVAGPDRGVRKAKQYLYPSEFLQFVSCDEVPLVWRQNVASAVYLFPRASELRALSLLEDVDTEHGNAHIHRSLDGDGKAKPTKTKMPRRFAIESPLTPLLRAMQEAGRSHVEMPAAQQNLSVIFRKMLKRAGVNRVELHEPTATRKAITYHDLRATGLTWMAVRGDDPLKIMQRAGHSDFKTTQLYVREAEAIREGFGDVFPPLPECLLRVPQRTASDDSTSGGNGSRARRSRAQSSPQSSHLAQAIETTVRRRGLEPPWELPR
jgi:integrase